MSIRDRVPADLLEDPDESIFAQVAAVPAPLSPNVESRVREQFKRGRSKYKIDSQPRDYRGRFRQILARLKVDLGPAGLGQVMGKIKEAEDAELEGDYTKSASAATDVVQLVDRIDAGALDGDQIQNIKATTRELGKVIAHLPMPQGDENAKLRFSDLPPSTQALVNKLKDRVLEKLDPDKARQVLDGLNAFLSGVVQMTSDELQSEMSKMLAYLID